MLSIRIIFLCAVFSLSVDCPKMINFAVGLNLNIQQPAIYSQIQADCCNTTGVTCSNQRVTQISWIDTGLDGYINNSALPSALTVLHLSSNRIRGQLAAIPLGLVTVYLFDNQLSGTIPSLEPGLRNLRLNSNFFNGTIPTLTPNSLTDLILSNNQLSGPLPSLPTGLINLKIEGNLLSGDLPTMPVTIHFLVLGTSASPGNHFSGTIILNQPRWIIINGNWITDIFIQDISRIDATKCDFSSNPLLGNAHLTNLTMCSQNGLYDPGLLPNTQPVTSMLRSLTNNVETENRISLSSPGYIGISTSLYVAVKASKVEKFLLSSATFKSSTPLIGLVIGSSQSNVENTLFPKTLFITDHHPTAAVQTTSYTSEREAPSTMYWGYSTSTAIESDDLNEINTFSYYLIFWLIGALILVCGLAFIARYFFKAPKIHSRFARRNSYSTLNTMSTTTNSVIRK